MAPRGVGIFPHRAAVLRLLGAVLIEPADEGFGERKYFSELSMRQLLDPPAGELALPRLKAAA